MVMNFMSKGLELCNQIHYTEVERLYLLLIWKEIVSLSLPLLSLKDKHFLTFNKVQRWVLNWRSCAILERLLNMITVSLISFWLVPPENPPFPPSTLRLGFALCKKHSKYTYLKKWKQFVLFFFFYSSISIWSSFKPLLGFEKPVTKMVSDSWPLCYLSKCLC